MLAWFATSISKRKALWPMPFFLHERHQPCDGGSQPLVGFSNQHSVFKDRFVAFCSLGLLRSPNALQRCVVYHKSVVEVNPTSENFFSIFSTPFTNQKNRPLFFCFEVGSLATLLMMSYSAYRLPTLFPFELLIMLLGCEYEFAEDEHVHSLHCFENENPHSPAEGCEANSNSVSKVIMSLSMLSLFMCRRVNVRHQENQKHRYFRHLFS